MKVLVFSPGHAVWTWAFPAALTAESLAQRGHDVTYLHCDSVYGKACMAQASMGVPWEKSLEEKARICAACESSAQLVAGSFDFPSLPFGSLISESDRAEIRETLASATPENYSTIRHGGLSVGRLPMYELIIQNMKRSPRFERHEWEQYLDRLENVLLAATGFRRAIERFSPDVCLIEHTAYSYNRVCQLVAEKMGVVSYFLNPASQNVARFAELLLVAKGDPFLYYRDLLRAWPKAKEIGVNREEAEAVADHFLALIQAKGRVYSTATSSSHPTVRERFGIRSEQKILLATTSSYDELFAAEVVGDFAWDTRSELFPQQVDWIKALSSFVRQRPELFLIIRVHPREFMAGNSEGISDHARELRRELENLPPNAAVNWPTDKISLYDLMDETAVGLNAWSTAGSELPFFGIPVVVYGGNLLLYPESLNYSAKTREEYFRMIDQALHDGWSFERIRETYRWYAVHQVRTTVDISDSFPNNILHRRSMVDRAYFKVRRKFNPLFDNLHWIARRAKRLKAGNLIEKLLQARGSTFLDLTPDCAGTTGRSGTKTSASETEVILEQLARLYKAMYGSRNMPPRSDSLQSRLKSALESQR